MEKSKSVEIFVTDEHTHMHGRISYGNLCRDMHRDGKGRVKGGTEI